MCNPISYKQLKFKMQSVMKHSTKSVQEYRHNIKLLKYHLKREQKVNETLKYKDAKKHKKQNIKPQTKIKHINRVYNMVQTVNDLNQRIKEMGLVLGDVFRMADHSYEGQITKEQFMKTIIKLKSNLDESLINQMFYAVDTNLNGMLSDDQYSEFLYAHGGCQTKEAITFQKKSAQKLAAVLKKKEVKLSNFLDNTVDPCPAQDVNQKLNDLKLNINESMILLKMWDPTLSGAIRHQIYVKSMENVKQKDQKQIQNEKFQKGIQHLCVIFREKKVNPITIFADSQADGKDGITPFELQEGLKKLLPDETSFQIRKWVNLINLNGDSQISKQEFISSIRSFYSTQQITNFSSAYDKLHPELKKALNEGQIPAQKIINDLSIAIQDNGLTKTEVFHRIDINNNGLIDKEELLEGLKNIGIQVGLIAKVLTVFDRDASGEVSLDQWLQILGEDVEMEDVDAPPSPTKKTQSPKKEAKPQGKKIQNPKKDVKPQEKKVQIPKKEVKPQEKKVQSPKKEVKPQQPKKDVKKQEKIQNKDKTVVKKKQPLKDKDKNKTVSEPIKEVLAKDSMKKPIESNKKLNSQKKFAEDDLPEAKNKLLVSKLKQDQQVIKMKKKPLISKVNQDETINPKKMTESKKKVVQENSPDENPEVNVEQIEKQIAQKYAKNKKFILSQFQSSSKFKQNYLNKVQLGKCLKSLNLSTPVEDQHILLIYEENISSSGTFEYQDWLKSLPEKYGIDQVQQQQQEEKIQIKGDHKKKPKISITKQKEPQTPKKEDKPVPNQSYVDQYDEQFDQESRVREHDQKRGENNQNFQGLLNLIVGNQKHAQEGYKLSDFIESKQQLHLLKTKYLPLAKKIKQNKKIYKDPGFPTSLSSLTDLKPHQSQINDVTLLKWKHYSELYKNPQLFEKGIQPNDIMQGELGDCYFLCSLASLAEYAKLIERLFEYYDIDNGYFLIWLCLDGIWKLIEVDGYVPVKPTGKYPVFSRSRDGDNQLWVMLLEKAYAKAYNNYEHIIGGQPYEAIKDMTGAPGQSFNHKKIDLNTLWQKLNHANQSQFMMTCGTDQKELDNSNKVDEHMESVTKEGIVVGHAYSILDLAVFKGEKLIQLRNPWGNMQWNGAWSDKSSKWTPQAKAALKFNDSRQDGIFWMPYQTYFKEYGTTAINYIRPNYFSTSESRESIKTMLVKIDSKSLKHGFVMVAQSDHRAKGIPSNTPYNVCHMIAINYKNGKVLKKISDEKYMYSKEGSVQIAEIEPNSQVIIMVNLEEPTNINLCTYANVKLTYEIDLNFDNMFEYIEAMALMEESASNVQTDQRQLYKSWMSAVGEYAFMVFKGIGKKQLTLELELSEPKNIKLLDGGLQQSLRLKPGKCDSIKGKIIDLKQPYSFGRMGIGLQM